MYNAPSIARGNLRLKTNTAPNTTKTTPSALPSCLPPNCSLSPSGKVQFLQLVGLTQAEINCLYEAHIVRMHADNRLPITNLRRTKNHI
jgi:hypothetical protein